MEELVSHCFLSIANVKITLFHRFLSYRSFATLALQLAMSSMTWWLVANILLADFVSFHSDIICKATAAHCPAKYDVSFSTCCFFCFEKYKRFKKRAPFDLLKRYIISIRQFYSD